MPEMVHACNPSTSEVETGESRDLSPPQPHRQLKTIMVYMRAFLKTTQEAQSWQTQRDCGELREGGMRQDS